MFNGSIVALVTPMEKSGEVDLVTLERLIKWHLSNETQGLVLLGTTGEGATLSLAERQQVLKLAVKIVQRKIPIIAGTGTNSTRTTVEITQNAHAAGVDACLVVTPYYNKPTQNGLYEHYKHVATQTTLPIIAYNVPKRTGCDLLPETLKKLAGIKNIVALKDATGDIIRLRKIIACTGSRFNLLSGDDQTSLKFIHEGGHGVISVAANIAPLQMQQMCKAAISGNMQEAEQINAKLQDLYAVLAVESNPIAAKWALAQMELIKPGIRLPLTQLSEKYHEAILVALQELDCIGETV